MMSLVLRQKNRSTQLIKEVLISYMVIRVGEIMSEKQLTLMATLLTLKPH